MLLDEIEPVEGNATRDLWKYSAWQLSCDVSHPHFVVFNDSSSLGRSLLRAFTACILINVYVDVGVLIQQPNYITAWFPSELITVE